MRAFVIIFQTSLDTPNVPLRWEIARLIPLKKPNKDDYNPAKARRLILLLSTLRRSFKEVVAKRSSFAVVMHAPWSANQFSAKNERSAEQTSLPQKRILEPP